MDIYIYILLVVLRVQRQCRIGGRRGEEGRGEGREGGRGKYTTQIGDVCFFSIWRMGWFIEGLMDILGA